MSCMEDTLPDRGHWLNCQWQRCSLCLPNRMARSHSSTFFWMKSSVPRHMTIRLGRDIISPSRASQRTWTFSNTGVRMWSRKMEVYNRYKMRERNLRIFYDNKAVVECVIQIGTTNLCCTNNCISSMLLLVANIITFHASVCSGHYRHYIEYAHVISWRSHFANMYHLPPP